ncbi:hypothetical protein L7F22_062095 [Adiantum nelumboides]|nr:hypothetical protein [Adiantum nelumboides]
MPSLNTVQRSHHRNESVGEAAFHRIAIRDPEILRRVPSYKEKQSTKPAARISKDGCRIHNVDSRPHNDNDGKVGKLSGCLSCFILPAKRPKDVSKACRNTVTAAKPNRDYVVENAIKAGINKTHSVISSPRHPIITAKKMNNKEKVQVTAIAGSQSNKKSSGTGMSKPLEHNTATCHTRQYKASERSLNVHTVSKTSNKPAPITILKTQVAPQSGKISSKPMSLIRPHLPAKAANRSSPPMNISSPQSAEMLGQITRRSSPISYSTECLEPFPKQNTRTLYLHKGPKPARLAEKVKVPADTSTVREKVTDGRESALMEKKVVWREGLLHRLGRLHGLGNCKLSLEELIELDDNACLGELESLQGHECAPLHLPTQRPSLLDTTRPSLASTWNMEFEGGRPILPLKRQDVSPEVMHSIVWPLSHMNYLFETSKGRPPNYTDEECR